jgi:hypothetical protein
MMWCRSAPYDVIRTHDAMQIRAHDAVRFAYDAFRTHGTM